jgi:hypothetical protein
MIGDWFPGKGKTFLFSTTFRLGLELIQPPFQWIPEALSPRVK